MRALRLNPLPRRWWLAILGLTLLQAAILRWGVLPPGPGRVPRDTGTRFALALQRAPADALDGLPWLNPPTLFAFPSLEGFSGSAWLRYGPPSLPDTPVKDVPQWLEIQTNHLGRALADAVTQASPPTMLIVDRPPSWRENLLPVNPPPVVGSSLRVEGAPARRVAWQSLPLPAWPFADVIADSIVQVAVDHDGRVTSASLVEREGAPSGIIFGPPATHLPEADRFALEAARTLRFAPLLPRLPSAASAPPPAPEWGRLVFEWQTLPVAVTNRVSPAAP